MGVESMIHTAYDVMKEFLITDADLEGSTESRKFQRLLSIQGKIL